MRLLIAGIIVFLHIVLLLSDLAEAVLGNEQIRPFLHTMFAHRGYHCIEKGNSRKFPSFFPGRHLPRIWD